MEIRLKFIFILLFLVSFIILLINLVEYFYLEDLYEINIDYVVQIQNHFNL
jgi:hypothetical protein